MIHATKIIKSKLSRQKNLKFLIWTLKRDIKTVPVEKDELLKGEIFKYKNFFPHYWPINNVTQRTETENFYF